MMEQEVVIRKFQKEDITSVVSINRECLPENYPDQFFLGLHYHAPEAFIVAQNPSGEGLCGYIMCRIERGLSSFGRLPTKKGHIVSVAVRPECRNQGIGSALIEAAIEGMVEYGASEFFLEVRETNKEAISVYENLGFEIKRNLKGYYRDGEDALLMVKKHEEDE